MRTAMAANTGDQPPTVATPRVPLPIIRSPRKMSIMPTPQSADQRPLFDSGGAVVALIAIAAPP